jgi:hypothetical protein
MLALLTHFAATVLLVSTLLIGLVSVFHTPGVTEHRQQQARLSRVEPNRGPPAAGQAPAPPRRTTQRARAKSLRHPAAGGYDEYTAHFNRAPRGWFSEQSD